MSDDAGAGSRAKRPPALPAGWAAAMAAAIAKRREAAGIDQERLAAAAGMTPGAVSLYQRGKATPSLAAILAMAKPLRVPAWRLVKDAEQLLAEGSKPAPRDGDVTGS